MSNLENKFSIYPYNPEDELTDKNAVREFEKWHRQQLAGDLGTIAIAAVTGIAGPEFKESRSFQLTTDQLRRLGAAPVSATIALDGTFMSSLKAEQITALNEQAVLGYAEQQEHRLAA
jgi:hypothetical protein